MKQINLYGMTCLEPVQGSGHSWYFATDYLNGDLYEAEEIFKQGKEAVSNRLLLVQYPEGTVYEPLQSTANSYFGSLVYDNGAIFLLSVHFTEQIINIHRFDLNTKKTTAIEKIPLSAVDDCYNLMLQTSPLMLTRQSAENHFEIIWPEQVEFKIHPRESFVYRDQDKLYFSMWHEDPDYREEIIVRSLQDGQMIEKYNGSMKEMPNCEWWHLI